MTTERKTPGGEAGGVDKSQFDGPDNSENTVPDQVSEEQLRGRLAAAAEYGQEVCSWALSPCSRDLAWWICRIGNFFAYAEGVPVSQLQREVTRAEHLWRACMEVEHLESGALRGEVPQ